MQSKTKRWVFVISTVFITLLVVGLYIGIPVLLDDRQEAAENKQYKLASIITSFEGHSLLKSNESIDNSVLKVNNTNGIASTDKRNRSTTRYHDFN